MIIMNDPIVSKVVSSLIRICGGGIQRQSAKLDKSGHLSILDVDDDDENYSSGSDGNNCIDVDVQWKKQLETIALQSISYPHGRLIKQHQGRPPSGASSNQIGKPHDVEVKAALSFFHYFRHKHQHPRGKQQQERSVQSNTETHCNDDDHAREYNPTTCCLEIISDLGLVRSIQHPVDLASLLVEDLEYILWQERVGDNEQYRESEGCGFVYEIKHDASGIICIVTPRRNAFLRSNLINRFPCPHRQCTKWVKGEKGLWWHQTREHGKVYSEAVSVARDGCKDGNPLAMVVYVGPEHTATNGNIDSPKSSLEKNNNNDEDDEYKDAKDSVDCYFQTIVDGNISEFMSCVKDLMDKKINVATYLDKNGASALHWAAGCGHLDMVQYLVTECNVPPDQPQKGKRSFRNRTPLHWAARNGHLNVVRYLVEDCGRIKHCHGVDLDAVTSDGTTAFCWACWQGHEEVMKYLYSKGANTSKLNSYGCNAVLWSAQSNSSGLNSLKWLHEIGSDMKVVNSNGHGMLHKSAQRGKEEVCRWILEEYLATEGDCQSKLQQIGPDAEGFCPSDLAGVEGFEFLAQWLTMQEGKIALDAFYNRTCPEWLLEGISNARHAINRYGLDGIYESGSGIKKMSAFVIEKTGLHSASHC